MNNSMKKKLNAALFKAVRDEDGPGTVKALQDGADPSAVSRGRTPMERAMLHFPNRWSGAVVGALIAAESKMPYGLGGREREALLKGLVKMGQAKALAVLLSAADIVEQNHFRSIIRTLLCQRGNDYRDVAELVFSSGREAEEVVDSSRVSWLHQAICCGHATETGSLLLTAGTEPRLWELYCNRRFCTSNVQVLDHLLSMRPNVNVRWLGMTPLHLAATLGNGDAFAALLAAGADPDLPDGNDSVIRNGYGYITPDQLALIENYRLQRELQRGLPSAASGQKSRL